MKQLLNNKKNLKRREAQSDHRKGCNMQRRHNSTSKTLRKYILNNICNDVHCGITTTYRSFKLQTSIFERSRKLLKYARNVLK